MKKFFQFCALASVALVFACGTASQNASNADSTATKADSATVACCASDSCATACTDSTACADSTCAKK